MRAPSPTIFSPPAWLVSFAFALPFVVGAWGQLHKPSGGHGLDLRAVLCAGDAWLRDASLYSTAPTCPFGAAMPYVYPPLLAGVAAWLQERLGVSLEFASGVALYVGVLSLVARDLFKGDRVELLFRAPFLCALTARALLSGNVSLLFHAALFIAVAHVGVDALTAAQKTISAAAKPTFVVYSAIFLFLPGSLARRLALSGASLAGTAIYLLWLAIFRTGDFASWLDVARRLGLALEGHSLLAWPGVASLPDGLRAGLYAIFACLLLAAGWAASSRLAVRDRLFVGVAVCILLNPRLMYYDHFTLPFGLAVLARNCATAAERLGGWVYATLCLGAVALVGFAGTRGGEVLYVGALALVAAAAATELNTTGLTRGPSRRTGEATVPNLREAP